LNWKSTLILGTLASTLLVGTASAWAEADSEGRISFEGGAKLSGEALEQRNRLVIATGAVAIGLYGLADWWKQGFSGDFHTTNEGWFGPDTYSGGADKLGHAFSAYAATRLLKQGFEAYGNDPERALWLGAATTFLTLTGVEVVDGYSKEFSFSKEDAIMNGIGVGLAVLFEKNPALDRLLDFRLHYWPSGAARRHDKISPVSDYSGQTYLLVAKAAAVPALNQSRPLRYLELDIGYGSRGYRPDEGPGAGRSRHAYLGISLNVAEILDDTLFKENRNSRARRITGTVLEYVQIPGTAAALVDHSF
jgi:hypothetical protein